ncbi:hypothetical protein MASR1M12_36440 [Erysipelotrichia bacterium]
MEGLLEFKGSHQGLMVKEIESSNLFVAMFAEAETRDEFHITA